MRWRSISKSLLWWNPFPVLRDFKQILKKQEASEDEEEDESNIDEEELYRYKQL